MRTNEGKWDETFRTVVTGERAISQWYPTGITIYGPFANAATAKSAGKRASTDYRGKARPEVSFAVERAVTNWEPIE